MKIAFPRSIWPLFLLPSFFAAHGFTEFFPIIPAKDAILLAIAYIFIGLLLAVVTRLTLKTWAQAYSLVFMLLFIEFFFGVLQDAIKETFPTSQINRYSIQLCVVLVVILWLWHVARKDLLLNPKFQLFVRSTLIVLITFDLAFFALTNQSPEVEKNNLLTGTDTKSAPPSHPNIFLIIADEYPGNRTLVDVYKYSNEPFLLDLKRRGFFVADSASSNYNFTEFSTASLFNMDYLRKIEGRNASLNHLSYCLSTIRRSPFTAYLQRQGYEFKNLSIFDFNEEASPVKPYLLPGKTKPLTEQTFSRRVIKDVGYHFFTDLPWTWNYFELDEVNIKNNEFLIHKTIAQRSVKNPTFTYTHLIMPHPPFYFDKSGTLRPKAEWWKSDSTIYFEYLQYCNNKLLNIIDSLQKGQEKKAAIILIGDHGLRDFPKPLPPEYHFKTLTSIFLPSGNYDSFYSTISHVNLLRATVNTLFNQQLPYLKDSTIFLRE